ncbi:IclR family transcriptional regulator [Sphingopyxis chilensis]|uniref:IclR family transcriptional regulator n=1 Tax=Sphingopyxis chilensis TaxID=180400 RepID=UPI002DDD4984|nr:helix-turn-helix domain-containing protein [Sphingopyxis chilensis]
MPVAAVVNAITILRYLAGHEGQGVNAIARATNLSPSTCFGILKTLVGEEFAEFDPGSKHYRLGTAPSRLFHVDTRLSDWSRWLEDQMLALANEFETCQGLWEIASERAVLIEVADSPLATRIHLSVGQRIPARIGAMGRCIAARQHLGREDLRRNIEELRWQSPPALDDYARSVADAGRGWAIDEGNYIKGVTTIAAAIADRQEIVRYCITSILFDGQLAGDDLARIGQRTADLAREAATRLFGEQAKG